MSRAASRPAWRRAWRCLGLLAAAGTGAGCLGVDLSGVGSGGTGHGAATPLGGTTLTAQDGSVESVLGPARALELAGPIESFASPADFVVRGQRVDASGADVRFLPGRLGPADLARGRRVEVRGTLAGAVLRAARVRFMDER